MKPLNQIILVLVGILMFASALAQIPCSQRNCKNNDECLKFTDPNSPSGNTCPNSRNTLFLNKCLPLSNRYDAL